MKSKFYFIIYFFVLIIAASACEDRTILHPGFPIEKEDDTVLMDFTFQPSTNYYGFVKFHILSQNIIKYSWSFGFLDKNGQLVSSNSSSPGIFFPANGSYYVTLKGEDIDFNVISITKSVTVSNFP